MIAVIDYGIGNLTSVLKAIKTVTSDVVITSDLEEIALAKKIILPGVGAYGDAVDALESTSIKGVIKTQAKNGVPLLGICLGMQLLGRTSEESPDKKGLELIDFEVKRFQPNDRLKVPHVGWNNITVDTKNNLFSGVENDSDFYFVHSYYVDMNKISGEFVVATCNYGKKFVCGVRKSNVIGFQFHPEKSQKVGLKVLKNFIEM